MEKQGAVWVSTVLYILISLAIIGMVIAAVTPRINSAKDKATIEQTIIMLDDLDSTIEQVSQVQGTKLKNEFKMSRGILTVNASAETITWRLSNSVYKYSEPNVAINISNIQVLTTNVTGGWDVELKLNYSGKLNLTSTIATLQPAEISYKLWVENKGNNVIDISVT